jgi:hypothetical protein
MGPRMEQPMTKQFARAIALTPVVLGLCGLAYAQQPEPANPQTSPPRPVVLPQAPTQNTPNPATPVIGQQAAQAPYYLGIQQSFTRESNHRLDPSTFGRRDNVVAATTLRGGVSQPLSRQRLFGDLEVRHTRYNNDTNLNNTGYALNAGVDFATAGRISGTVSGHATRSQTRFVNVDLAAFPDLAGFASRGNTETTQELRGVARLGSSTPLTFEVGGDVRKVDLSATPAQNFDRVGVRAAVLYRLGFATTVGLGVATAKTDFADGDSGKRNDVYGQVSWVPSSTVDLQGRVAQTRTRRDINVAFNYTGVTGSLVANWRPTSRLAIGSYFARDTGQDIGFLRLAPEQSISGADVGILTNSLGVRGTYELTSKILLDANAGLVRRRSANLFSRSFSSRTDNTVLSLGARWAPTRNLSFGCSLGREQQERVVTNTGDSFDTRAFNDVFGCYGAFTIF